MVASIAHRSLYLDRFIGSLYNRRGEGRKFLECQGPRRAGADFCYLAEIFRADLAAKLARPRSGSCSDTRETVSYGILPKFSPRCRISGEKGRFIARSLVFGASILIRRFILTPAPERQKRALLCERRQSPFACDAGRERSPAARRTGPGLVEPDRRRWRALPTRR